MKVARVKSSYGRIVRWAAIGIVCVGVMVGGLDSRAGAQFTNNPNDQQPQAPGLQNGQNQDQTTDTTQRGTAPQNGTYYPQNGTYPQNGANPTRTPQTTQRGVVPGTTEDQRINRLVPPPEPPTEFQRMVASTTGRQLQIFGSSLFGGEVLLNLRSGKRYTGFARLRDWPGR